MKNLISIEVYVIMDKKRGHLLHFDSKGSKILCNIAVPLKSTANRILTYDTEGRAKSGLREAKINSLTILENHYPELLENKPLDRRKHEAWLNSILRNQLEVVKVVLHGNEVR